MSAASPRCAGVLFDLDGTLLDSAPDLAAALAVITREQGLAMPDYARVRAVVSAGGSAILRTAWPQAAPEQIAALLPRYLEIYAGMLAEHSRLFPGIDALLARIERAGLPWGIVTNKIAGVDAAAAAAHGFGRARRRGGVRRHVGAEKT
ncbi:phosphoglycolate phosphatase [mine drainage metagenome]|uniref:Phosphoglycolate phosphatase n=1 Tax=mine drainage metagenome TaxID=410659 RepID=T1BA43_9ZZZZ